MMHRLRRYDVFRFAQNDVAPLRSAMMRCLPLCARRHTSFASVFIIRRSQHHLPKANIIQKTHLCLGRQKCVFCWRRRKDLNLRAGYPTYTLSRGASSPLEYFSMVKPFFNLPYYYIKFHFVCQVLFQGFLRFLFSFSKRHDA